MDGFQLPKLMDSVWVLIKITSLRENFLENTLKVDKKIPNPGDSTKIPGIKISSLRKIPNPTDKNPVIKKNPESHG